MKQVFTSLVVLLVLCSSLFLVGCGNQTLDENINYLDVITKLDRYDITDTRVSSNLAEAPTKELQEWLKELVQTKLEREDHFDRYKKEQRMLGEKITYDWWLPIEILKLGDRIDQIADELKKRNGNTVIRRNGKVTILPSPVK